MKEKWELEELKVLEDDDYLNDFAFLKYYRTLESYEGDIFFTSPMMMMKRSELD